MTSNNMSFSMEDKIVIKYLRQKKPYGEKKILKEMKKKRRVGRKSIKRSKEKVKTVGKNLKKLKH